ncbi:radical SAM protein, partial [candidate division WOR-3 bacterium]|nr:radical SAM protein [candidate division WOR-3 bacterium]
RLQDEGCSEIILISQDATSFGKNSSDGKLPDLIGKIEKIVYSDVFYRIPYLHPKGFDEKLIDVISSAENLIKCLDIPVQHFSDRLLKKMNRHSKRKFLIDLFYRLRERIQNAAFRTTFITGFFGETDKDIEILLNSARKIGFERSGVFPYSLEECTPAEFYKGLPDKKEAKRRLNIVRKELSEIMLERDKSRIGKNVKAVIEGYAGNYAVARTDWDMPDVDKTVFIRDEKKELTSGKWTDVKIQSVTHKAIYAETSL